MDLHHTVNSNNYIYSVLYELNVSYEIIILNRLEYYKRFSERLVWCSENFAGQFDYSELKLVETCIMKGFQIHIEKESDMLLYKLKWY